MLLLQRHPSAQQLDCGRQAGPRQLSVRPSVGAFKPSKEECDGEERKLHLCYYLRLAS
jgi:hypothetical protein